jgi:mono/diheme cytochrome c family protein
MGNWDRLSLPLPNLEGKTAMRSRQFLSGVLLLASVSALAVAAQNTAPVTVPPRKSAFQKRAGEPQTDGERVFKQNCFRCHTEPEGFSPRISGTIVRHLRVRASLSQREEEQLLQFLNP